MPSLRPSARLPLPRLPRLPRRLVLPLLLAVVLLGSAACTGFHTVSAGQVYRDRQPHEDELITTIDRYGIKTVICLRGDGKDSEATQRAALVTDTTFVRVPMSARRLPEPDTLRTLWSLFEHAERPLLLHCKAGVDRTGLASAIAVLHDTNDLERARGQLATLPYGHLGAFGTEAMRQVLDRYAPYHDTMSFPQWIDAVYEPDLLGK